jgi:hypothetical protein
MNAQSKYVFESVIRKYFKRLAILVTQIPPEVRRLLLPPYMLYTGFKSYFYIDQSGRLGFEIYRERASRFSIKTKRTFNRIEQEIFGILGDENIFKINGSKGEIKKLVLTCSDFVERYKHELPERATILAFSRPGIIGPIEIGEEAEVKIIDCSIYWIIKSKRYVKHVPFAWLFGNANFINRTDPLSNAESDFYSSLFGNLYEIITRGYEEPVDKNTQSKVLEFYKELIKRVEDEFKKHLLQLELMRLYSSNY